MITTRRSLALALPLLVAVTVAAVGPPWIAIEYPANPLDPETRGALMVVRTYHHEAPSVRDVAAEAIGDLDGRRITRPLEVRPTSRAGVFAIHGDMPGSGAWVIRVSSGARTQNATALVAMNDRREILAVRVPHEPREGGRWMVPRAPTGAEIDVLLRTASAMENAASSTRLATGAGAALLLLLLVPSGIWIARRR